MKIISVLSLIICFIFSQASAQRQGEEFIRLSGIVFDSKTMEPLQNVSCRLDSTFATTDRFGRFAMNAMVGDTVSFSHIGYQYFNTVIPDSLMIDEYIVAIALSSDTLNLAEVVVIHRYGEKERLMSINAKNNVTGAVRGAFVPNQEMTKEQNQQRILNEYAASTNKGHVNVGLGVGTESWDALNSQRRAKRMKEKVPELLNPEEVDLVKAVLQYKLSLPAK
ncbi:carboxypeptidase-like regulatory domain-containing protein [Porphyromonadaceae bacterium OttesenSCG-928-L07]|nr:carboxypeptidase-like regulatory domain-containing protein [Porphyromonadaceae bacterium OttesenSCG-928-L07]